MKIKRLGIYTRNGHRLIPTGKRMGLLHEFKRCCDLNNRSLYYPADEVKPLYLGNTEPCLI